MPHHQYKTPPGAPILLQCPLLAVTSSGSTLAPFGALDGWASYTSGMFEKEEVGRREGGGGGMHWVMCVCVLWGEGVRVSVHVFAWTSQSLLARIPPTNAPPRIHPPPRPPLPHTTKTNRYQPRATAAAAAAAPPTTTPTCGVGERTGRFAPSRE
jgi:hypothetical protein